MNDLIDRLLDWLVGALLVLTFALLLAAPVFLFCGRPITALCAALTAWLINKVMDE